MGGIWGWCSVHFGGGLEALVELVQNLFCWLGNKTSSRACISLVCVYVCVRKYAHVSTCFVSLPTATF